MEHVISIKEFHLRKVERKEAGETSRGHDQPVIVTSATEKLSITVQEKGSNSSEEEKFKKLEEARVKLLNRGKTKPKIRKVVLLRDHKNFKKYCEPRVVSLGPIHYDEKKYQVTEEYKLTLADNFIEKSEKTVKELYDMIKKKIEQLRECFDAEVTKKYGDEDLAWMLFVDGCATLKFIDIVASGDNKELQEFKIKNDHVAFVQQDLFLLENQLPYQLLDVLMKASAEGEKLEKSIQKFINKQSLLHKSAETMAETPTFDEEPIHLLDLLRKRLLGHTDPKSFENVTIKQNQSHDDKSRENDVEKDLHSSKLDSLRSKLKVIKFTLGSFIHRNVGKTGKNGQSVDNNWQSFHNVQEPRAIGIRLKCNHNCKYLGEISFKVKCNFYPGILWLPPITVDDSTGPKFLNLVPYEMCPDFDNDYGITSYISFLESLIDEPKHVIDLRKVGILRNLLGSDDKVAQVFNEIGTDLVPNPEIYSEVKRLIQNYYKNEWKTWISEGLHTHFSSPWTLMAFLVALFAILAIGVQTVYSVLSYYQPK